MSAEPRKWKGVIFNCCGVYGRVYQNPTRGFFTGNCPRCATPVKVDPSEMPHS